MRLSDYTSRTSPAARAARSSSPDAVDAALVHAVREALYEEVPARRIAELSGMGCLRAREELSALVEQIVNTGDFPQLTPAAFDELAGEVADLVLGLGPIEDLLADESVTEVVVNGPGHIFFERDGVLHPSDECFASEEQLRLVVDRIVSPIGRRVDEQSPLVNARLPEGHRVNVVIPPISMKGTAVTIRKFRESAFTLEELVGLGSLSAEMATLLAWAVAVRKNIAVSGGTGGGKTTLLNALSRQIPPAERIVTIEDSAELRFDHHPDVVSLEARMPNAEGKGEVTIRELVVNALRMRPDRIIVGECRGAEAADMLQAMNTGHDGSMTTLHANSPAEVMPRLVMMVRYGMDLPTDIIESQVRSALDLIVQQDRMPGGERRITQIVESTLDAPGTNVMPGARDDSGVAVLPAVDRDRLNVAPAARDDSDVLGSPGASGSLGSHGVHGAPGSHGAYGACGAQGSHGAAGSPGSRRATAISTPAGSSGGVTGEPGFRPLVEWDRVAGEWVWLAEPCWLDDVVLAGIASAGEVGAWRHATRLCS